MFLLLMNKLNFRNRQQDLPPPPGYSASVGQSHVEASRETDPSLVVKVRGIFLCQSTKISDLIEIMGHRLGAAKTDSNESVHNVHGRKFDFNLPHHDGGYVVHASVQGTLHTPVKYVSKHLLCLGTSNRLCSFLLAFKMIEGAQHILQKFIYLVGNVACVLVALYKCHSMGLLPTHPSDWLDFLDDPLRAEYAGGGLAL